MNTPFIYDRYVTSRDFIGRKSEYFALTNLIESNENIVIYEPPKSGKRSLLQQVLFNLRLSGKNFSSASINMFNIRTSKEFLLKIGEGIIRAVASAPHEYENLLNQTLGGTSFSFDKDAFSERDEVVHIEGEPKIEDWEAMLTLHERIAKEKGIRMIVVIEEFQCILNYADGERILKIMENIFKSEKAGKESCCNYILIGSRVNEMKHIFEIKKYFYRCIEHLSLFSLDEKELVDHIRRGFLKVGKDIDKERAIMTCNLFKGNIWYINHFLSICNSLSIGYINEGVMMDALNAIISIHEPRLLSIMASLTDNQISYLKAILDGVQKFSSAEMVERYDLHSSANVKRVREALFKKEVVTNNESGAIVFMDPLFEYWVKTKYFQMA